MDFCVNRTEIEERIVVSCKDKEVDWNWAEFYNRTQEQEISCLFEKREREIILIITFDTNN